LETSPLFLVPQVARRVCAGIARGTLLEAGRAVPQRLQMTKNSPFRYVKTSPEIIRLAVILYALFAHSLRNVVDVLHELFIEISHEKVRFW
jgi:hypothetical protein